MKFIFFTIPAIFSEDATKELDKFCASHKVTDVEKQFVSHGNDSFWSFCVLVPKFYFGMQVRNSSFETKFKYRKQSFYTKLPT